MAATESPVVVTLDPSESPGVAAVLARAAGVRVVTDAPVTSIISAEGPEPARILEVDAVQLQALWERPHADRVLAIIRGVVDDAASGRLEDAGIAWVDEAGHGWFPGAPRVTLTREQKVAAGVRALRPESVRLAQILADHPGARWTERALAKRGGGTQVTAHRLLKRLEGANLVVRDGAGREGARVVSDASALRSWLAVHARPKRVARLHCFIPEPFAAPRLVGEHRLALTGAKGAERMGRPVLSHVPLALYRVDARPEQLEDLPQALGGFRTDAGANLALIADPWGLGFVDARRIDDGALIAPPSRIMLDLFLEPRGEAAAEIFRDLWTER